MYPACATEQEALDLVLFLHDNATRILANGGDGLSPVVHVSCADTLRDIMAGSGTTSGIFTTDTRAKMQSRAKAFLPGFCITLRRDHSYTTVAGARQVEQAGAYQAQFHWHEGEGRLTLDPVSKRTADSSARRSISHPFAYHGLPFLLEPVFRAWHLERTRPSTSTGYGLLDPISPLQDLHPVIQAQFLGVRFPESGGWSPAWNPHNNNSPPPRKLLQEPKTAFTTPPRGAVRGPSSSVTPPPTVPWSAYRSSPPVPPRPRDAQPRASPTTARGGGRKGTSRWSPELPKQVHWGQTTTLSGNPPLPCHVSPGRQTSWRVPSVASGQAPGQPTQGSGWVMPQQADAPEAVSLLQKLTSFMALRDPELLAAAAEALGAEAFTPVFSPEALWLGQVYPDCRDGPIAQEPLRQQPPLPPDRPRQWEEERAARMRQQEEELALLEAEAETTRSKIAEARRQAEEAAMRAAAAAAREEARQQTAAEEARRQAEEAASQVAAAAAREEARQLKAAEAARAEEARRQLQREQAARASALAAEAAKLAAAQALADAREQELKLAVQTAKALKEEQDREQARLSAEKAAAEEIALREAVLAAKRVENARLVAELKAASQEAEALNKDSTGTRRAAPPDKEARRQRQAEGLERQRQISLQRDLKFAIPPPTCVAMPAVGRFSQNAPATSFTNEAQTGRGTFRPGGVTPPTGDRDMTPRRRSAEAHRPRGGLSPLGRAHFAEGAMHAHKKAQRVSEDNIRRDTARSSAVEDRRARSPILGPDLYAMLGAADAARATVGLPAHTMESFLLYLQNQVKTPQAAHQNAAPQDPTEDDLRSAPSRSQGAPAEGHCQMGGQ